MEPITTSDPCSLILFIKHFASILFSETVLAAIIAPLLGLSVFRRQREYELVRQRYLDDGLDIISGHVEYAQSVFRHNWARSLSLIKLFRDAGKDTPKELYSTGFIQLDPSRFEISRNYILKELVGDDIFIKVQELLFAYVSEANSLFINDLCHIVKMYIEGSKELEIKANNVEISEKYLKYSIEKDEGFRKFYSLLGELRNLSEILVREKFTFPDINNFKEKQKVKESAERLKTMFEDELNKE
ncbi:MAG: hypothetical protein C0613_05715 [Desulfobulbaceae bacterium]|nr:MAG: hypothetical protein C0613_05715 [Desulfobulbaceae bacterium]